MKYDLSEAYGWVLDEEGNRVAKFKGFKMDCAITKNDIKGGKCGRLIKAKHSCGRYKEKEE